MSLPITSTWMGWGGFPRVSGDEPSSGTGYLLIREFSPRERG